MFKSLTVFTLLALLAVPALLRASVPAQPVFTVDFSTLLWAGQRVPWDVYYLDGQGQPQPVALQSARRSTLAAYRGRGPLVFVRKEQAADGTTVLHEVGRVEVSAEVPRILILFAAQADGERVNLVALPDGAAEFPPGSYKLVNATGSALDLRLGQSAFTLPAGAQHVYRLPQPAPDNAVDVVVRAEGGSEPLFAGVWPSFPALRTLVFFHRQSGSADNAVDTFIVSDVIAPAEAMAGQ